MCRGLNVSDKALFGKEIWMFALSMGGHAAATKVDRVLVPGDACLRGIAFGYEPVKLKFGRGKVARRNFAWQSADKLNANT